VAEAKENFNKVALTGAVFALQILWDCSFDWGKTIRECLPKYSFARMDNPNAALSPGFNFR
jgi:P2X purinoceptor 4